jgi:hypothetical protein
MDPPASASTSQTPAAADPPSAVDRPGLRDPWVRPGLALLAIATVLAALLYRAAPQSAAEVGSSALVAVAPDAFTPHLSRARERRDAAMQARAAGDTAGAIARLAEGEEEAMAARQRASDSTQTRTAAELWAGVVLDRAELMLAFGAGPWYRGDNDQVLQEALAAVNRAQEAPLAPATRARAAALDERIRRQLRPGPLEWLPR